MSQIINELATIEVSNEVLQQLDVDGIYQSFSENFQKLDDLKKFRKEHEEKHWLMRWWDNDKLQNEQLSSAVVQAEFSKTIGQLMMISIMQSKKLADQQMQLNDQQGKLKTQADGIAAHAGKLQEQHQVLAEQSQKLEELVREYFELKGLTEEGAQKLIDIAREVKATKDQMLQEFASRTKGVEAICAEVQTKQAAFETQVSDLANQQDQQLAAHREKLGSIDVAVEGLSVQSTELAAVIAGTKVELSKSVEQQQYHQDKMADFQKEVAHSLRHFRYFAAGMSVVGIGILVMLLS